MRGPTGAVILVLCLAAIFVTVERYVDASVASSEVCGEQRHRHQFSCAVDKCRQKGRALGNVLITSPALQPGLG